MWGAYIQMSAYYPDCHYHAVTACVPDTCIYNPPPPPPLQPPPLCT